MRLVGTALLVRCAAWLGLCLSHAILPDFNPGDDVLQYSLSNVCSTSQNQSMPWFWQVEWYQYPPVPCSKEPTSTSLLHRLFLQPLTRWDSARFLHLAADPGLRTPRGNSFESSEQAHAFLPLFPWLLRVLADSTILPDELSLSTRLILSGILLNSVCFLVACQQLRAQTKLLFHDQRMAERVALLFLCNPALPFFATTYSESLTAALLFTASHQSLRVLQAKLLTLKLGHLLVFSILLYLACWTRSNAVLWTGWLLLYSLGNFAIVVLTTGRSLSSYLFLAGLVSW